MSDIQVLKDILKSPRRTLILMHQRPDGDAFGCALAMAHLCKKHGHQVTVISPTLYPQFLSWIPGAEEVIVAETSEPGLVREHIRAAEVIFCLDFGEYKRLGSIAGEVAQAKGLKIVIDHHAAETPFGDTIICDIQAPATALLVYRLLIQLGMEPYIDKTIAMCLYIGIVTDTGSFTNSNTNAEAHAVTAKLIEKGVDIGLVNYYLQSNSTLSKLRFTAHAIMHRLNFYKPHGFAYFAIPREDFMKFNLQAGDTGGLVKYALNLEGVHIAVLLTEQKEGVYLSFRSFGEISVNDIATTYFQGGGHKNAAGGISSLSLQETSERLVKILIKLRSKPAQ